MRSKGFQGGIFNVFWNNDSRQYLEVLLQYSMDIRIDFAVGDEQCIFKWRLILLLVTSVS